MRRSIVFASTVLVVAAPPAFVSHQVAPAIEAATKEMIEVMLRQGGRKAATELAAMGGEAAVREVLERAASEGGEALVERIAQYGSRYGPSALKAVERSPSRMISALDGLPPDLVQPAIRAAAREPEMTSRLVAAYGKDALEVAAKHPGVGTSLAEKLGKDGIAIGQKITTDQAVILARYADDIAKLPAAERRQLLSAMSKAPAAVLDYLETHPKVLLTAGGVAAIIAAKDNLFGSAAMSSNHESPPTGLVERVVFGLWDRLTVPIMVIGAIIGGGIFGYVAIQLRTLWKRKALRLEREVAPAAAEKLARPTRRRARFSAADPHAKVDP